MSSRKLIDLYLPGRVAYHVKIILGSFLVTMFFNLIWRGTLFPDEFWISVGLVFIQLEIIMFIAFRVFPRKKPYYKENYRRWIVKRLILFYFGALGISVIFLFGIIYISMQVNDVSFADSIEYFVSHELKNFLSSWLIGVTIGSVFFFYMEWTHALKREQRLREEKLIFQYETLKNQVNPHFLFNSLNTLSSLVSVNSELAERFIAKFSSIYRYILENKDKDLVSLEEEMGFVNNYFFLQKIRDDGKIEMEIDIDNIKDYEVLPISLQILVENALKHNAATMENPLLIRVSMESDELVYVENPVRRKMQLEPSAKIGLKNLKERTALVMKKELIVEESQEKFVVKLPVKRKSSN